MGPRSTIFLTLIDPILFPGAFLIPYALNIFLTGIPLFFLELAFGQFASKSPVAIWSVSPLFKGNFEKILFAKNLAKIGPEAQKCTVVKKNVA